MDTAVSVLIVTGSIRRPSHTFTLAERVRGALEERRAACVHWDLSLRPLPLADPRFHGDPAAHPDTNVRDFVRTLDRSDGIVLASPIYHNSFSGVLKNALDLVTIPQFQFKAVGLLSHGDDRSTQAVDQLRTVVRGLHGYAITTQVCTGADDYTTCGADAFALKATDMQARITRFANEFSLLTQFYRVFRRELGPSDPPNQ